MFRQIDTAIHAFKIFIKMTHCVGDRCTIGTFNDNLSLVQELEPEKANLGDCLNDVEAYGGTRLYDSLCDAVDYLHEHGDSSRSWFIFALTYNNDNRSTRSAEECKMHIFTKYANKINRNYIFVISVGRDINSAELDSMEIKKCLYHIHVKSSARLENDLLWRVGLGEIVANRTSAMDYVVLVNNSTSMGVLKPLKQQSTHSGTTQESQSSAQDSYVVQPANAGVPLINSEQKPMQRALESSEADSKPPVLCNPALVAPPVPQSSRVTIRMREFLNRDLHADDRQIFREFAVKNYPNIPNSWKEDDIVFLVLVESRGRSIVGLLVMLHILSEFHEGYHNDRAFALSPVDRVHIRLMVVDKEFRGHGLGTRMLAYVAGKYRDRVVTLNVTFDRMDLLNFYYDKGYVKFEEFSTKHKVIVFSLVHLKLLASMPFPG